VYVPALEEHNLPASGRLSSNFLFACHREGNEAISSAILRIGMLYDGRRGRSGNSMQKTTQIKDIARALGISIGTVDRALHDRGRISPLTKERVLQMAKTLGYQPNAAARALSSRRRMKVSVNLPIEIAPFWDAVREGIQEEAGVFAASGIEIEFRSFPRLGQGEKDAFEEALAAKVNGIIMATGRPEDLRLPIRNAARVRIPVVAVSTDAPGTARLAVVAIDSLASGSLAGELLGRLSRGSGELAVVTGDLRITDHAEKFSSFRDSVRALFPKMKILKPLQNHEDEAEAYEECKSLFSAHPGLEGLYISTANSPPVLEALKDSGRLGDLRVIATDLFPPMIYQLESGGVVATLYQRPRSQGQLALRLLHDFLVGGRCPSHQMRLAPHLIMKSNLSFFLQRMSLEPVAEDSNGRFLPREERSG
jgi:LacI family transcriptional regulator